MRGSPRKPDIKKRKAASLAAVPDPVTTCPRCGGEIGLWSKGEETICIFCEFRLFQKDQTTH